MRSVALTSFFFLANLSFVFSQVAINIDGSSAHASAMMEVKSTNSGFLITRMTSAQRTAISSPATGLLVYQIDAIEGFYYFDGTSWERFLETGIGGDGNGIYDGSGNLSGNTAVNLGTNDMEFISTTGNLNIGAGTGNACLMTLSSSGSIYLGAGNSLSFEVQDEIVFGSGSGYIRLSNTGSGENIELQADGNLVIGSNIPGGTYYEMPNEDGKEGEALITDGAGSVSWKNPTGSGITPHKNIEFYNVSDSLTYQATDTTYIIYVNGTPSSAVIPIVYVPFGAENGRVIKVMNDLNETASRAQYIEVAIPGGSGYSRIYSCSQSWTPSAITHPYLWNQRTMDVAPGIGGHYFEMEFVYDASLRTWWCTGGTHINN